MTAPRKILIVAGARPNFMKVAPIVHEIKRRVKAGDAAIDLRLIHTGQHYDQAMSDVFFADLGMSPPDINLGVGSGTHAVQTANVMCRFEPVCVAERPDWVVVVGDVNSTLACTLVCAKTGIKVAHVEAGLRSFDRSMPEEVNRIVTDALADLLLTPSLDADDNLLHEGIARHRIRMVGNVMIDSLIANLAQARDCGVSARLGVQAREFAYVTLHRPANVDGSDELRRIAGALERVAQRCPVIFAVHPRTRAALQRGGIDLDRPGSRIRMIEPVGYHKSLWLVDNARFVLTDSGGIQEESTYLHTPCLTLRPNTERPVTISEGSNRLTNLDRLTADIDEVLGTDDCHGHTPRYWDGHAAERIVDALLGYDSTGHGSGVN
ncbi:MAG: UDP-N-acetylglucosamine 2-epimerase (non-hydrolyzing) [Burkholderiales bacterium]|nr:UDP-N-acetylglucosamine 2-epimerase (non-hydrolyzing) [Burkholderiales bacterium]